MRRMSTFCDGGPLSNTVHTVPASGGSARLTKRELGSITVDHSSWKLLSRSRFFRTTCTGDFGHGNRSDSPNVRCIVLDSAVVSHSPDVEAEARGEKSRLEA